MKSLSELGFPTAGGKGNTLRVNLLETETAERVVNGLRKRGIYTKGGFGKPIENQKFSLGASRRGVNSLN